MTRESARPLTELDRASRAKLEHLMGIDPKHVVAEDMAFLQARRDYLTADQKADYGITDKAPKAPKEPTALKVPKEPKAPKVAGAAKKKRA